jgi:hypothetical protein
LPSQTQKKTRLHFEQEAQPRLIDLHSW